MKNGQFIMTYEHCATQGCKANYRVSSNPESWMNATEYPLQLPDGTAGYGTPYVVYLPNVGPNGAVVVSTHNPDQFFVNYQYAAPGSRWVMMQATVEGAYSRSFVTMDDGESVFITATPVQSNGLARWEVGNQHLGDVSSNVTSGNWYLVNRNSGKYLEVANASTADGGFVSEYSYTGSDTQKWRFEPANNGYYHIVNVNSDKFLEVQNAYVNDNRIIQQWSNTSSPGQEWRVVDQGTGYIKLFNRNSGKTFDIHGSTDSQPQMLQYQDTGAFAQQWKLVKAP
ncbi:RICIN domain-containing protein [Paenibacillus sp. P26]|nr:RICIN domain-containing protein [Paenibacillus sp. P26]UUZ97804.1 RICIN domain-containing protein [Paenibacillus sp. P25]